MFHQRLPSPRATTGAMGDPPPRIHGSAEVHHLRQWAHPTTSAHAKARRAAITGSACRRQPPLVHEAGAHIVGLLFERHASRVLARQATRTSGARQHRCGERSRRRGSRDSQQRDQLPLGVGVSLDVALRHGQAGMPSQLLHIAEAAPHLRDSAGGARNEGAATRV